MIDAILFIPSFSSLAKYLDENYPEMLERDEAGAITDPPVVAALTFMATLIVDDKLLAYCRFTQEEAEYWRGTPGVEILGEAPWKYGVEGTAEEVYRQVFENENNFAKYESVYQQHLVDESTGDVTKIEKPKFGVISGA